ncbi:MAG: recombinase family protein [Fusobacteriaceae bacterium]
MGSTVGYCRDSSDNQREESITAQIRAIENFCKQHNHNLIRIYSDEAISGTSTNDREKFKEMTSDSKNKSFEYVIVHKLDRFARNRYDSAVAKKLLKDNGVKVLSVLENLSDSPESVMLESILEGMNEYYSLNLAREVKKGLFENAHNCLHNGGTPPLGYDIDDDQKYVVNTKESIIVKEIFNLYSSGYGYSQIAIHLNHQGLKNKLGRPFSKTSIRDHLLNEKYIGIYTHTEKKMFTAS